MLKAKFSLLTPEMTIRLGGEPMTALAEMVYSALPDFYSHIPLERERVLEIIAAQIGTPGTELEQVHMLAEEGAPVAVFSVLRTEDLVAVRQAGTMPVIRALSGSVRRSFMTWLAEHGTRFEPLVEAGVYLPRLAVSARHRRRGLGAEAMEHFVGRFGLDALSLHVHEDNTAAIALYDRFGFRFRREGRHLFRLMVRDCSQTH